MSLTPPPNPRPSKGRDRGTGQPPGGPSSPAGTAGAAPHGYDPAERRQFWLTFLICVATGLPILTATGWIAYQLLRTVLE